MQIIDKIQMHFVADISQCRFTDVLGIRGQHVAGVADQHHIHGLLQECAFQFDQVVSHLFKERYLRRLCSQDDIGNDFFAVILHCSDDVVGTRMVVLRTGVDEVMCIKRFVINRRIITLGERVHQSR